MNKQFHLKANVMPNRKEKSLGFVLLFFCKEKAKTEAKK